MKERRNFDAAAALWDEEPRRLKLSQDIAAAIKVHVPVSAQWDAMDYGCGTGLVTLQLAPHLGTILGVDSSQGMLDRLATKVSELEMTNVAALRCNLEQGELPGRCFDLITSAMTFHHIPEPLQLLKSLHSLLKSGGWIALADLEAEDGSFHDDPTGVFQHGFSRGMMMELLESSGFQNITIATIATVIKGERSFPVFLASAMAS
jgi:ubiquinone/menaquinone biosynthesis C-methylase UbiE